MNERQQLTPLARSKMLNKYLEKSVDEALFDEQHDVYKAEINKNREFISQSNIQHESRLREIRISYESKLQLLKKNFEEEVKDLQDRLWTLKHSFDQDKQVHLSRAHRFAIEKLEYSERIENLLSIKQKIANDLMILENNQDKAHMLTINSLKAQYDAQSTEFRIEKRRCEELIIEEQSRNREKLNQKNEKIEVLIERKKLLKKNLEDLQSENTEKMQKIEKSLRTSQKKVEVHEDKMNQAFHKQIKHRFQSLEQEIEEKEQRIFIAKEKNEDLLDQVLRLEKILYGKLPVN